MKRIIVFAFMLFISAVSFAQMMPDSTVQFVARWNVGEKYSYWCEEKKYEVYNGTDTVNVKKKSEIRIFEVIAKTDSTYQIRLTYKDSKSSDPNDQLADEIAKKVLGETQVLFSTGIYGNIISVDNLQELVQQQISLVDPLIDAVYDSLPEEQKSYTDKEAIKEWTLKACQDENAVLTSVLDEISHLYMFHGARLKIDEEYSLETEMGTILPDMPPVKAVMKFWADKEYTDEYSALCRIYSEADKEQFSSFTMAATGDAMANSLAMPDSVRTIVNESIRSATKAVDGSAEEYVALEVHLNTGWPLNYSYARKITIIVDDSKREVITERDNNIIVE